MTNHAIARTLRRLGDLLEIEGEDPFKVRAYRKAADSLEDLTESIESIAQRGELQNIPGVGKAIAAKVTELVTTGHVRQFEEARARVPEGLVEVLALPGIGPKKARQLHERLGIGSVDDLERAAVSGRLAEAGALGLRPTDELLSSISEYRVRSSRWPIGRALSYAEALARELRAAAPAERVEIGGSIRRMCDTAGNVDLVAVTADEKALAAAFVALGEIGEPLSTGAGWVRARSRAGPEVTLHVAAPGCLGARWRFATGSAEHNRQFEARARELGISVDELGVLRDRSGAPLGAEGEEATYAAAGLAWIPPELREGRGEIEAAANRKLPDLVTAGQIRGILHAHSLASDGTASIAQMADAARALGHEYLAITDHSKALGIARGLDEARVRAQMTEIDALNAAADDGFRVLKGIEVDILGDGVLDLPLELLRELDVVIGSVHSHFRQDTQTMTARVIAALETGCLTVLAHPTGRILGAREPYAIDLGRVIDTARTVGTAMEINASPERLDLSDSHARQAADADVPISVNTDAHHVDHLGYLSYGIATARRAWLGPENVINCWPLERLTTWQAARKARHRAA